MKIKTFTNLLGAFALLAMFASCSSSTKTASSFGERKYAKGYFFNNPASAANTVATGAKTADLSKQAVSEKTQSIAVVAKVSSPVASANVTEAPFASQQVMPTHASAKKSFSSVVAEAKTEAIAKSTNTTSINSTEGVNSIETTAQVQHSGGGFHFRDHPVRYILVGLLIVLIIVLLIVTGGQGYNSRTGA